MKCVKTRTWLDEESYIREIYSEDLPEFFIDMNFLSLKRFYSKVMPLDGFKAILFYDEKNEDLKLAK